eukprot:COSAG06_NODE_20237_length_803_cov_1.038352_1_plen_29_part_10
MAPGEAHSAPAFTFSNRFITLQLEEHTHL